MQEHSSIYIGVDTAISGLHDNLIYRIDDNGKKTFAFEDKVIFCSGRIELSTKLMEVYQASVDKSITFLRDTAKKLYSEYLQFDKCEGGIEAIDIVVATVGSTVKTHSTPTTTIADGSSNVFIGG